MELLVPVIVSILTQGFKWLTKKIGHFRSKLILVITIFVFSFIYATLIHTGVLNTAIIVEMTQVSLSAIGVYELVYKKIIKPILNK